MSPHFCPNCGEGLAPDAHFCAECGHHIDAAPSASNASDATEATDATAEQPPPGSGPPPSMPPPTAPPVAPAAPPVIPPPPGPVPPAGDGGGGDANRTPLLVAVSVLAVLLLAIGAFALFGGGGDDDEASHDKDKTTTTAEVGDEIVLEPVAVTVPDPFTDSTSPDEGALPALSTSSSTTLPEVNTGAAGGAVNGSAPGLYGGTRDKASCDPEQLIAFLQAETEKAKAWAEVQGIPVEDIPTFVRSLTPVILRRDTRVLNHGYKDGKATPRAAVLQAGTAVLVDGNGIPRVKCGCGNPLGEAPPLTTSARYTGTRWTGFSESKVVVVRVDVTVETFVLVDIQTGVPFDRPAGTTGDDDVDDPKTTTTTTTTTRPPTTTTHPPTTVPPTSPPSGDRSDEAIAVVEGSLCGGVAEYITAWRAWEVQTDLYHVEFDITLDSGAWTPAFEVEFASEFPLINPLDGDSASVIC